MEAEESTHPTNKTRNNNIAIVSTIGILLCFLGIADSTYLTIAHYTTKVVLSCPSTGFINCAKVTNSSYSVIFGVPAAVLGLLFFIPMLILQLPMIWRSENPLIRYIRLAYSIAGLMTVFWLVYVEFHKLNSICLYCSGVHLLTFLLFVITIVGSSIISPKKATK